MIRLARMFEIALGLADTYRLKNEFFQIMKVNSSGEAYGLAVFRGNYGHPRIHGPHKSLPQLVQGDPERHGLPLDKRLYRRVQ